MASLAAALQARRLRHVEPTDATAVVRPTICADTDSYLQLMSDTFLEEYIDAISAFTFASACVKLSVPTAAAIGQAHREWLQQQQHQQHQQPLSHTPSWRDTSPLLVELAHKIDAARERMGLGHSGFFVRLSSRSPKDAALSRPKFLEILHEQLGQIQLEEAAEGVRSSLNNQKVHAVYRASTLALKVLDGFEAVELLVESARIQDDLVHMVHEHGRDFNVIVRQWGAFDAELEFRAFVYDGRCTAVTQYNQFCFFPRVVKHLAEIQHALLSFVHERMVPTLTTLRNYVLDLALRYPDHPGGDYTCYVVEVNPFAEFAGTGLFTWETEWQILMGRKPFEFRVVLQEVRGAWRQANSAWLPAAFFDEAADGDDTAAPAAILDREPPQ